MKKLITLTISSFMRGFIRQFVTFVYIETSAEKYAETDQSVLLRKKLKMHPKITNVFGEGSPPRTLKRTLSMQKKVELLADYM